MSSLVYGPPCSCVTFHAPPGIHARTRTQKGNTEENTVVEITRISASDQIRTFALRVHEIAETASGWVRDGFCRNGRSLPPQDHCSARSRSEGCTLGRIHHLSRSRGSRGNFSRLYEYFLRHAFSRISIRRRSFTTDSLPSFHRRVECA